MHKGNAPIIVHKSVFPNPGFRILPNQTHRFQLISLETYEISASDKGDIQMCTVRTSTRSGLGNTYFNSMNSSCRSVESVNQ